MFKLMGKKITIYPKQTSLNWTYQFSRTRVKTSLLIFYRKFYVGI